jgi:threonine dehydrogenase-like Zn-dependent dehydrogenase
MKNSVVLLTGPLRLEVVTTDLPGVPEGWVRVRYIYCGLCGSDRSKYLGRDGQSFPMSVGHEFVAEVEQIGAGVQGLDVGDLVTSDLNHRCGRCDHCQANRSHLCRQGQVGLFTNRALAARGDIHAGYLMPLGSSAAPHLTLAEPLSCALHALDWAEVRPEDRILVIGAGGLGSCLSFALVEEASTTFDVAELDDARRAVIAAAFGSRGCALVEPDGEYDIVFDVSGTAEGIAAGCRHVRAGGRFCTLSHLPRAGGAPFLLDALSRRDVTFTVSYLNGAPQTLHRSISMLQQRWADRWDPLVQLVPFESLDDAFAGRLARVGSRMVVDVGAAFL